jgi:hypothetical protein
VAYYSICRAMPSGTSVDGGALRGNGREVSLAAIEHTMGAPLQLRGCSCVRGPRTIRSHIGRDLGSGYFGSRIEAMFRFRKVGFKQQDRPVKLSRVEPVEMMHDS